MVTTASAGFSSPFFSSLFSFGGSALSSSGGVKGKRPSLRSDSA
jgi:hypothetical protein